MKARAMKVRTTMIHVGRKVPMGFRELSAIHLGRGIWMILMEPVAALSKKRRER